METFKPSKKVLQSKINCIFFIEIEPERDGLLELSLSPSEDATLSIYYNVSVNIQQYKRIYSSDVSKQNFHIELFSNKQGQYCSKVYNGSIHEISILLPQNMLKYFFRKTWIPSEKKPFKTIDDLSSTQIKVLSDIFSSNNYKEKLYFVQQFLCMLSVSKTTNRLSE